LAGTKCDLSPNIQLGIEPNDEGKYKMIRSSAQLEIRQTTEVVWSDAFI
jgi:hypothetical protein